MKHTFATVFVLLCAGLLVVLFRGKDPAPEPSGEQVEQPRYTLRGAHWRRFDVSGSVVFSGIAETIRYFDDDTARMTGFQLVALDSKGGPWTATAPEGYAPAGVERLQLLGGVEGRGRWPDGEALDFRTEELWLDTAAQEMETQAAVSIRSARREVDARGFKVGGEPLKIELLHDVRMRYVPG